VTVRSRPDSKHNQSADVFYVPAHAVLEDKEGRYVYIAQPVQEGLATAERRNVQIAKLTSLGLGITEGLNPGDLVIVAGMSKMYPGLQVRLERN
jgi:hypothetical protein